MDRSNSLPIAEWRADPAKFIREVLVNPETGRRFELFPAQNEFLRRAFTIGPDGRLRAIRKAGYSSLPRESSRRRGCCEAPQR
jgi:hypothetical protein